MIKQVVQLKVYIDKSKIVGAGRGVFAAKDLEKGELIESCPAIKIDKDQSEYLGASMLVNYCFYYGRGLNKSMLVLGYGSIYNHAYKPNARCKIRAKDSLVEIVAIADIQTGTEITFDYNFGKHQSSTPLWFE